MRLLQLAEESLLGQKATNLSDKPRNSRPTAAVNEDKAKEFDILISANRRIIIVKCCVNHQANLQFSVVYWLLKGLCKVSSQNAYILLEGVGGVCRS